MCCEKPPAWTQWMLPSPRSTEKRLLACERFRHRTNIDKNFYHGSDYLNQVHKLRIFFHIYTFPISTGYLNALPYNAVFSAPYNMSFGSGRRWIVLIDKLKSCPLTNPLSANRHQILHGSVPSLVLPNKCQLRYMRGTWRQAKFDVYILWHATWIN